MKNKDLKRRILEISYKHKLSHIGSCLTAVDIIDAIYHKKGYHDKFILSSGHAGLAQYVVIEKYSKGTINAEMLYEKHGVHPNRDTENGIWASTGSLGHGICIGVGMAVADTTHNVYVLCSDGEMAEGSVAEALNYIDKEKLGNIKVHVNCNGFSALGKVYPHQINSRCNQDNCVSLNITNFEFPFLEGLNAHYMTMTEDDYKLGLQLTSKLC